MHSNVIYQAQDVADLLAVLAASAHPLAAKFAERARDWQRQGEDGERRALLQAAATLENATDDLKIDPTAAMSISDDAGESVCAWVGAWVQAWVYVTAKMPEGAKKDSR